MYIIYIYFEVYIYAEVLNNPVSYSNPITVGLMPTKTAAGKERSGTTQRYPREAVPTKSQKPPYSTTASTRSRPKKSGYAWPQNAERTAHGTSNRPVAR